MAIKQFLFVDDEGFYTEGHVEGTAVTRACDSGLAVGDLVMESETISNGVDKIEHNGDPRDVIGYCVEKPSSTSAHIMTKGVIDGVSGITKGSKVYLSETGGFSSSKPTSGYFKILGHAIENSKIDFDPINTKVKIYKEGLSFPLIEDTLSESSTTQYGYAVATDGNTMIVSEIGYNGGKGRVHLYKWDDNNKDWTHLTAINYSNSDSYEYLGWSVDIVGDRAIAGAPRADYGGKDDSGRAYTFKYENDAWSLEYALHSSSADEDNRFGDAVCMTSDLYYIGEPNESTPAGSYAGVVHVYSHAMAKLCTIKNDINNGMGRKMDCCDNRLIVNASHTTVYIYETNDGGHTYTKIKTFTSSNMFGGIEFHGKNSVILGDPSYDSASNDNIGCAYVYDYNGSDWILTQTIICPDDVEGIYFGSPINVYDNYMVIGGTSNDTGATNAGSAYIYEYNGSTWVFKQKYINDTANAKLPNVGCAVDEHGVYLGSHIENLVVYLKKA